MMTEKTFNTLTKVQKILLLVMAVACIAFVIFMLVNARSISDPDSKISAYSFAMRNLIWAAAMICAFVYAQKGYSKEAAGFYKAMMAFYALSSVFPIVTFIRTSGFGLAVLESIIKVVLLLVLAFGKDLGKRNTWILYSIVFVFEIIHAPLANMVTDSSTYSQVVLGSLINSAISRLVIAGLLGLCIVAKYRDKEIRGSK